MPQGSSAVRPTNSLYLFYLYPEDGGIEFFYSAINHITLHHRPYTSDIYGSDIIDLPYFQLYISIYIFESTI